MTPKDPLCLGRVVGDVLQPFTCYVSLRVDYSDEIVISGGAFKPSSVIRRPRVQIGGLEMRRFYTLVMVDPDMPRSSNPTIGEYLHWMVVDIPGTTSAEFGREVVFYESPTPAGIHRLVFAWLKQPGRDTVYPPTFRHNFKTIEFARGRSLLQLPKGGGIRRKAFHLVHGDQCITMINSSAT